NIISDPSHLHHGLYFSFCALQVSSVFTNLDQLSEQEKLQKLLKLNLRYFTPREVANLMGFPQSFWNFISTTRSTQTS
uniref:Uncharacterized protein n=1 Tax=Fundulus heteroclitus TaxID=8078 RepID=A0A3Q2PMT3_FUNHE